MRKLWISTWPLLLLVFWISSANAALPIVGGALIEGKSGYVNLNTGEKSEPSQWVQVGKKWGDYSVVSINLEKNSVRLLPKDGIEVDVPIASTPIAKTSSPSNELLPLETLDWKWIRSDENPMRRQATQLPIEVAVKWNSMTEAERTKWINYYRRHGFALTIAPDPGGLRVSLRVLRQPGVPRDTSTKLPIEPLSK